jgi:transcription initiation factor TFIIB
MSNLLFPGLEFDATKTALRKNDDWSMFDTKPAQQEGHICPECDTDRNVQQYNDELICHACGTHMGFMIDSSAEYRWFGSEDRSPDPTRVGNPMNPLLPESSLGTRIMSRPGDNKAMRRIRQYHLWNIMPYRERTLWTVFEMLHVRASNAGISLAIVEETKQLYAQVSPLCICRGQQKDALLAACLYESLKRHDTPRRPVDIAEIFQIDVKLITRGVKQFSGLLEEHLHSAAPTHVSAPEKKMDTPSTNFRHYLEPAICKLETPRSLHGQIVELAMRLGDLIDELGICPETTPSSLAASALALTCEKLKIEKPNADIARVCSISLATLQKCLKRIESWRAVIFKESS